MVEPKKTRFDDVLLFPAIRFGDYRGQFEVLYEEVSITRHLDKGTKFVQDNISRSHRGVLRGMHFQQEPYAQGKLVTCLSGEIYDVVVDIRPSSPDFLKWEGFSLSQENGNRLYVPTGFAHGFLAMTDGAVVHYKVTNEYRPDAECTIAWNAPDIGIEWPLDGAPIISSKDEVYNKAIDILSQIKPH